MKTNKKEQFTYKGVIYEVDDLLTDIFISNPINPDGKSICSVNMRMKPFIINEFGEKVLCDLDERVILVGDAFVSEDVDMQTCLFKINSAIQEFIYKKNI
jgi:hypothetical protein